MKKMWHLKPTTMMIIVGALNIIKKGRDKLINHIRSSTILYEIQKKKIPMSFAEYYQCN